MSDNNNHHSLDLSGWYTEPDAAAKLGISDRTLRRWASKPDGPERMDRRVEGRMAQPVYNPADIDRLAARAAKLIPPGSALLPSPAAPLPAHLDNQDTLAALSKLLEPIVERVVAVLEERLPAARPEANFLTLQEASVRTGLTVALLNRMIVAGKLPYFRDRNWQLKVPRKDLDNLDSATEMSKYSHPKAAFDRLLTRQEDGGRPPRKDATKR